MSHHPSSISHSASDLGRYLAMVVAAVALSGCNVKEQATGVIAITVSPGETGTCESSPCAVSLVNEISLGSYPAGQTAQIGSFWQTQAIEVKGANVPKAYVYIPNTP